MRLKDLPFKVTGSVCICRLLLLVSATNPSFFVEAMCGFFRCCEGYCSAPPRIDQEYKHPESPPQASQALERFRHNSAGQIGGGEAAVLEASGRKRCVLGWFVAHGCRAWDRVYFGAKLSSIIYNYITCMVGGYRGSRLPGDTSTSTSRGIPTASATCF